MIEDEIKTIKNKCFCYRDAAQYMVDVYYNLCFNNNLINDCSPKINCLKHIDKKYYTHNIKQYIRLKKLSKING